MNFRPSFRGILPSKPVRPYSTNLSNQSGSEQQQQQQFNNNNNSNNDNNPQYPTYPTYQTIFVPYGVGVYVPVVYYPQPVAYVQPVLPYNVQQNISGSGNVGSRRVKSTRGVASSMVDNQRFNGIRNVGYSTVATNTTAATHPLPLPQRIQQQAEEGEESKEMSGIQMSDLSLSENERRMSAEQLYAAIMMEIKRNVGRVSWLNRMLSLTNDILDLERGIKVLERYNQKLLNTNTETGTLFIKAACRVGVPERALEVLQSIHQYRIFPSITGMHYLMVNFALKRDTQSLLQTLQMIKQRQLKPTARTYHILVRECVDNDMVERALKLVDDAKANNVTLSRVSYNILMNGCRRNNLPLQILKLRAELDELKIEKNDTTVKFTILAHVMLEDMEKSVAEFLSYTSGLDEQKLLAFCDCFFESTEKQQHKLHVVKLFHALQDQKFQLPSDIEAKLDQY